MLGNEQAQFRRSAELIAEPGPLRGPEQGGRAVGGLEVFAARRADVALERAAEVAGVEQDDLGAAAGWPENFRVINAFPAAARRIRGHLEEIHEQFLRADLFAELRAGVVQPVVVVVPGGPDGAGLFERLEAGQAGQLLILLPLEVGVVGVGIDVVAEKQEEVGLRLHEGFPNGLGKPLHHALMGTGTERDAAHGGGVGGPRRRHGRQQRQRGGSEMR
jgi:hypothetical protein